MKAPFLDPEAELARVFRERLRTMWEEFSSYRETEEETLRKEEELYWQRAEPYARVVAWFNLLDSQDPLPYHHALVRRAFFRQGNPKPTPEEVSLLSCHLMRVLREMRNACNLDYLTADQLLSPSEEDGMMWLLAKCARYLERRPGGGAGSLFWANWLRQEGKRRWEILQSFPPQQRPLSLVWFAFFNPELAQEGLPPVGLFSVVARALLIDQKEEAERPKGQGELTSAQKRQETVATLAFPVAQELSVFCAPGELKLSEDKTQVLRGGSVLARVATLDKKHFEQLHQGLAHWGQLCFRRAVNYLVRECWARYLAGEARPDVMEFQGPNHFAELIGETSHKGHKDILEVLTLGQAFSHSWPGGHIGGLWTFRYLRACRGRPAWLEIRLGGALEPHYGMGILDTPFRVPVVTLPPFVGRYNDHAAQSAFFDRLLLELVDRRLEVVRHGGALLGAKTLERFALDVGMETKPTKLVSEWESPTGKNERYLWRKGDLLFLADSPPTRGAREFILEAGRRSLQAKKSAKKGILKKQKQIQGRNPRKSS